MKLSIFISVVAAVTFMDRAREVNNTVVMSALRVYNSVRNTALSHIQNIKDCILYYINRGKRVPKVEGTNESDMEIDPNSTQIREFLELLAKHFEAKGAENMAENADQVSEENKNEENISGNKENHPEESKEDVDLPEKTEQEREVKKDDENIKEEGNNENNAVNDVL